MVLRPSAYVSKLKGEMHQLKVTDWDILQREETGELEEAQRIVRIILERLGITEKALEAEVTRGGKDWIDVGFETIDTINFENLSSLSVG